MTHILECKITLLIYSIANVKIEITRIIKIHTCLHDIFGRLNKTTNDLIMDAYIHSTHW